MRRLLSLTTLICLLLVPLPGRCEPYPTITPLPGYTLRASTEPIIVFAAMNAKANIAGYLIPGSGQEVLVYDVSGTWCHVSFSTDDGIRYGYVPLDLFDVAPQPTPTPEPSLNIPAGTAAWVVNIDGGYRLNLRQTPSAAAKSLGKYYTGTAVTLTGRLQNGFAEVLLAGSVLGWMDLRFLSTDALSFVPAMPLVTVRHNGANLRSGPGSSFQRIGWYDQHTPVTVLGVCADGWYHVMVEEQIGYMAETLLSGTFAYDYGMDSDHPTRSDGNTDQESVFYINTRTSDGQLNLRKAATSSSKSLGVFYTGTALNVLSYTRTGWAYVCIGQTEGYMDADYLTLLQPTQYGTARYLRNTRATGLNLRSTPSSGGELLAFAPNGSAITLLGVLSDGWCYVEFDGKLGYMLADGYLKTKP